MDIAVIGRGGHSKVVQDLIRGLEDTSLKAILDDKYIDLVEEECGLTTGPIASAAFLLKEHPGLAFIIAIGDNRTRMEIAARLGFDARHYVTLIHPSAVVSPGAYVGQGAVIMANAVVQADANVGHHSIVNTGALVEHDCIVEDYVHLAPRAVLTGSVTAQRGAFIGAGAVVIPDRWIGEWSVVGAGATVIEDVPSCCTVVGNPAKIIKCEGGDSYVSSKTSTSDLLVQSPYVRCRTTLY